MSHLETILKKQCEMVGAPYEKMDFKKEYWFQDYTWSRKKQDEFKKWLMEYLKDKEARESLMDFPINNKKHREKFADKFIMNYGWMEK